MGFFWFRHRTSNTTRSLGRRRAQSVPHARVRVCRISGCAGGSFSARHDPVAESAGVAGLLPARARSPPVDARLDTSRGSPAEAHFFLAVCSIERRLRRGPLCTSLTPRILLREREQHIFLLQDELEKTRTWLEGVIADRSKLIQSQDELKAHLEEQNRWALQWRRTIKRRCARIAELQDLMQSEQAKAMEMAAAISARSIRWNRKIATRPSGQ